MILTEREQSDIDMIKKALIGLSNVIGVRLNVRVYHILERMHDRNIDALTIIQAIWYSKAGKFADQYRKYFNDNTDQQPFRVEFKTKDVILSWHRRDDHWTLTTILDPEIHSKYDDKTSSFYARINHF